MLAAMETLRFEARLNSSDALLWTIEKDPHLRTTIVAVSILDRPPNWDRLWSRMSDASALVPRMRQRVVDPPLRLGPPRWEDDAEFDLGFHLRHVAVTGERDLRAVLDLAGPIAMAAFDRDRPLWEFTLVEGLAGGRAALIQKLHHCVTDGVGAVKLARLLLDDERDPSRAQHPAEAHTAHASHNAVTSAVQSVFHDALALASLSSRTSRALPGLAARTVTDPSRLIADSAGAVRSIGKLLAPALEPLSPVMRSRGLSRRLDAFDLPIDSMLAAAHAVGGSLNDAFLAAIAGGMRRYHERHGKPVERLRVTMPINTRRARDAVGNNRFTPARFALPIATVDAGERMRELGALARSWRAEPALPLTDVIAGALQRLPAVATVSIFGSMLKAIDFVATNVPGLPGPSYLAGAEVVRQFAFAPPSGAAFSVALLSHADLCCIGINADTVAIPDPEVLTESLRDGFEEVVEIGRRP